MRTIIIIILVIKREGGWTSLGIRKINHVKATFYPNSGWESPEWRDNSGSGGKRLIGTVWSVSSGSTKIMSIIAASEIAKRIGVSRAVLYKWKDEIIGNSAYQTMRKHNEPSLEAERDALRGGSRPTESGNTPPADGAGYSEKSGGNHIKSPGHQYQSLEQQRKNKDY